MDQKEKPVDQDLSLAVVLPDGEERMTTVHGRYCLFSFHLIYEMITFAAGVKRVIFTVNIAS